MSTFKRLVVVFGLVASAYGAARWAWSGPPIGDPALPAVVQVSDSTYARLATTTLERDSLAGLIEAERTLHGQIVAALRLIVPPRDTEVVHDTLPTVTDPVGTRSARFRDSTFAGTIEGTITAPPSPAPLGFTYTLRRPAFSPAIGIIATKAGAFYAVVTWQGERAQASEPFFRLPKDRPSFRKYVSGAVAVTGDLRMAVGVERRTATWTPFGELSVQSRVPLGLWVGVRRSW